MDTRFTAIRNQTYIVFRWRQDKNGKEVREDRGEICYGESGKVEYEKEL